MNTRPSENLFTILIFGLRVPVIQFWRHQEDLSHSLPVHEGRNTLEDDVFTTGYLVEKLHELDRILDVDGVVTWTDDAYVKSTVAFRTCHGTVEKADQ